MVVSRRPGCRCSGGSGDSLPGAAFYLGPQEDPLFSVPGPGPHSWSPLVSSSLHTAHRLLGQPQQPACPEEAGPRPGGRSEFLMGLVLLADGSPFPRAKAHGSLSWRKLVFSGDARFPTLSCRVSVPCGGPVLGAEVAPWRRGSQLGSSSR